MRCRCTSCPPSLSRVHGLTEYPTGGCPLSHSLSFRGVWSTAGSHTAPPWRQILFLTLLLWHLPPELSVRFSFTRPCDPLSVTMPPQLFVLVCSSRLMLELYNERFRGRKLLSCLAFPFINHRLTDLLSLQTAPPPHLSQRHSRCSAERPSLFRASGELSLHSHRQSVQGAERSRAQHAGKFFTCRFIQNIHKELRAGTQRAKATPPLARIGCWLL